MVNKQKTYCAIISVEFNSEDIYKAHSKIEDMAEQFNTYHGESNILGLFEEAQ